LRSLLLSAVLAFIVHGLLFTWKAEWVNKRPLYAGAPRPVTVFMAYKKAQAQKPSQPELTLKPEPQKEPIKKEPPKKVRESKLSPKKDPPPKPKKKQRPKPETRPKTLSVKKEKDILPPAPPPPPPQEPASAKPPEPEFYPERGTEESPQPESNSTSASLANERTDPVPFPKGDQQGPKPVDLPVIKAIPHYKKNPPPVYPRMARRRGHEGTVLMEVLVSREGRVEAVRLLESSGHDVLDHEAMSAVKRWVFEPARRGEEKVEMWVKVPVRFKLR
jgi:protein TonB